MNKRITKKFENRLRIRSYRKFKEQIEKWNKDYEEYLESLKRPKTEEEKYWDKFWEDFIG